MTAVTTPAGEIQHARKVYEAAYDADWKGGRTASLLTDLYEALDLYEDLDADRIHPAAAWDDLAHEDEAKHIALQRAARDAGEWAREVMTALPELEIADDNGGN